MSSLVLRERKVTLPPEIKKALSDVRKTWTRPDGEEFQEAIQLYQCLQQLACGFFYRWKFVRGETPEQIETWLARRSAYNREVRDALKRPRDFLDSPGCLRKAAERYYAGEQETEERPHWRSLTLRDWAEVEDTVQPVTEAVWLSEYLIDDVAEWAKKNTGIIWYQHAEFGKRLEKRLKLPRYGGGPEAAAAIENEKGDRSVIASIDSHSTGRNLQRAFSVNLVCTPPSANTTWEQMLGRTHRQGQEADEVSAEVYRHTEEFREAIDTAVGRAYYVLETTGASQKLSYADVEWR